MVRLNDQHNFIQPDFNEKPRFNKNASALLFLILSLAAIGYFLAANQTL